MFEIKNNCNGFTMLEVMVSLMIIAIISSIMMANFNAANKSAEFTAKLQQITSDIRLAQANSYTQKKSTSTLGATIPIGWGIKFFNKNSATPNTYIIYYNTINSSTCAYDSSPTNEAYDTVSFNNMLTLEDINSTTTLGAGSATGTADFCFFGLNNTVYLNGSVMAADPYFLRFTSKNSSTKFIQINPYGLVGVQ